MNEVSQASVAPPCRRSDDQVLLCDRVVMDENVTAAVLLRSARSGRNVVFGPDRVRDDMARGIGGRPWPDGVLRGARGRGS